MAKSHKSTLRTFRHFLSRYLLDEGPKGDVANAVHDDRNFPSGVVRLPRPVAIAHLSKRADFQDMKSAFEELWQEYLETP
jgi:uncharacterized protein YozE (UPF0346 family)